ncbi:hypothetical protein JTE90_022926 [Oedothorax gibbosus]|uniref:lysozyme n=1 Tax=Oedothorax gibbosus TaxID=931172 RepID=A0AAV6U253_9ARAC|nr:hypothetical protein JTE90_022926 [Oedothorax gibbosus]
MSSFLVSVGLCLVGYLALVRGQGFSPAGQISEKCFQCLCEASSDCDLSAQCEGKGPGQYFCGPYQMTFDYWRAAGRIGENPDDPLDFEKCLNSKPCAEATIRGYMYENSVDCNGDSVINCHDWARIHKTGPLSCNNTWILNTDYWSKFTTCYKGNSS